MNLFSFPANILKAGQEKDRKVPVEIIPNAPTKDRVNDKILLKAFDEECVSRFLYDGIIDYDHLSVRGKTELDRAKAIIGQPSEFFIDDKRQVPVCKGFLFRGNPYVEESVLPALEAGSGVFAASIGGNIVTKSLSYDPSAKSAVREISKLTMNHIAVTPKSKAIHQDTSVRLAKSAGGDEEVSFLSFEELAVCAGDPEYFMKAIEAGSATDSAGMSGGQSVQAQSLEGDPLKLVMPFVAEAILRGRFPDSFEGAVRWLVDRGLSREDAERVAKTVAGSHKTLAALVSER